MSTKSFKIKDNVLYALIILVIGILLIIGGASTAANLLSILITVMGVVLIVLGILNLASHNTTFGLVQLLVGILIIVFGWTMALIAFIVLGVLLVVYGLQAFSHKHVLSGILDIVEGVLIVLLAFGNHFAWEFANIFFYITGALMIVDAILILVKK